FVALILFSTPYILFFPSFFFFNVTATTDIYTLSLHDALPIFLQRDDFSELLRRRRRRHCRRRHCRRGRSRRRFRSARDRRLRNRDRKSTRLNSSHVAISYAVFCLKKKKSK